MNPEMPPLPPDDLIELPDAGGSSQGVTAQLMKVHLLLKGRYAWAISLSVVGLVIGGLGAYLFYEPIYRSTGIIRIAPVLPRVLYQSEQSDLMPMFDAFVQSQVSLIQSRRVVDLAMTNADWAGLGRGTTNEAISDFISSMAVSAPPRSELIMVSFDDEDPRAARLGVAALIRAYEAIYQEFDISNSSDLLQVLEERRTILASELKAVRDRKIALASEFGSDSMEKIYQSKLDALSKLEAELNQARVAVTAMQTALGLPTGQAESQQPQGPGQAEPQAVASTVTEEGLSAEELATVDSTMKAYLQERLRQEANVAQLETRYGSRHREVERARQALAATNRSIELYLPESRRVYTDRYLSGALQAGKDKGVIPSENKPSLTELDRLRAREKLVQSLYDQAKAELVELGRKQEQIAKLDTEEQDKQRKLNETLLRIDQVNVESAVSGRVQIVSRGDEPISPYQDRTLPLTLIGGGAGASLGFGSVLLVGLMDRRLRHLEDAQTGFGSATVLGSLPNLPAEIADPNQASNAAHCVHHIRNLLQLGSGTVGQQVFAITSPAAGSGKTSLTLSLGLSFAATECRTLMLDCDLVGAGLTSRVNAIIRRKIGQVLLREGAITEAQLQEALEISKTSPKRLGAILVDLGYLDEARLDHALELQSEMPVGLLDALAGEPVEQCVTSVGIDRLFILPLGAAQANDAIKLSRRALRRVLDEARRNFDIILIDTGPILGSLEASITSTEADSVVMIIARGDNRSLAEKAFSQLGVIGARIAGVVFNRADIEDFYRSAYTYGRSLAATSIDAGTARSSTDTSNGQRASLVDPVAHAVASSAGIHARNGNADTP